MANCPVCQTKTSENAKYCAECGVQLSGAAMERAWIISMQEKIKSVRQNDVMYNIVSIVGLLIAVVIPFVTHFVLLKTMDRVSWILTVAGVLLFMAGFVINMFDERKMKKLIQELASGGPLEIEETESEEETEE